MARNTAENNMRLMPWQPSYLDQAREVYERQSLRQRAAVDSRRWEDIPNFDIARNKERGFKPPVIDPKSQIRVLQVLPEATAENPVCQFDIVDLNASNSYFALSYTWGNATAAEDVHDIFIVDGLKGRMPFSVRQNVWEFLTSKVVRNILGDRPIYIDAICINQLDNDEKAHQVQLMHLQEHGDWVWTDDRATARCAGEQKLAVKFISSQPYWSRTWIIQEILLPSDITILVGDYAFPWSQVAKLRPQSIQSSFWHVNAHGLPLMNMTFVEGQMRFGQRSAFFGLLERKAKWNSEAAMNLAAGSKRAAGYMPCYMTFGTFAEHACSDARDKFYAMLGIMEDDIRNDTIPDYSLEVHEVYRCALQAAFRSAKVHLQESLKMRLEAYGILATHLHEAFGLAEANIGHARASALADPDICKTVRSDIMEACLLQDDTGAQYKSAQLCRSSHTPNGCAPSCLLTSLILPTQDNSSGLSLTLDQSRSEELQQPASNLSLPIHIRGTASGDGGPLNYQAFEYGQWSGRTSLRNLQNLGLRPEAPCNNEDGTDYKQCLFYTDRERGDGDMYWMVHSPHGGYTAAMSVSQRTGGSSDDNNWTISYEDAIPKPHDATCSHCDRSIVAVRYRCLQCLDFELCSPCMKEATSESKDDAGDDDDSSSSHIREHHFEPIYHPASSMSFTTNPFKYLALNFRRVPYRMHPAIFTDFLQNPDQKAAVRNCLACGIMFPWSPRSGIWPPYWIANLDIMTWNPVSKGAAIPHIRCIGLRLRASDPTDRPPTPMPGGYRFFGQIQLCAIRQQLALWANSFSPPVVCHPELNLVELVDRRLQERQTQGVVNTVGEGGEGSREIVLMLPFPPQLGPDKVNSDSIVEEGGAWGLRLPRSRLIGDNDNGNAYTAPTMCFWTADDFDEQTIAKMKADAGRELRLLPVKATSPSGERQWVTFRW